jgi:hypothetical protein
VRLGDVVVTGLEHVEREPSTREQEVARRTERVEPLAVVGEMEVGAERARHEAHALLDRRVAQVADAQVEELAHAGTVGLGGAHVEHPARRVDADDADPGLGSRDRDPPGADAELDDRPAGLVREVDVELDVLADAPAPGVVERGDRVVRAVHGRYSP